MSGDSITEVTSQGLFSRFGNSIKGMIFGIVLVVVAVGVMFWNEGRAVRRAKDLSAGSGALVTVESQRVDHENDGRLVHFTGDARTAQILRDREFNMRQQMLRLRREVEMFQWVQNESGSSSTRVGGSSQTSTTYSYEKEWSPTFHDSSDFKLDGHDNPRSMQYQTMTLTARDVSVGGFKLPEALVSKLNEFTPIPVPANDLKRNHISQDGVLYIGANKRQTPDPADPQIGDMRVNWSVVLPGPVSVVGQQHAGAVEPWTGPSGSTIFEISAGTFSGQAMFAQLVSQNRMMTWLIRAVCTIGAMIGFGLLFAPLGVIADVLPPVGALVRLGTGMVAFGLGATVSVATIGVGWVFYRPLVGIPLLVVCAAGVFMMFRMAKKKQGEEASATSAPAPVEMETESEAA